MKKILLLLCFLWALPASAQNFTVVSGQIKDPNSVAYFPGQVQACLTPQTNDPIVNGQHVNPNPGTNYCVKAQTTSDGSFSMSLPANASITPAATQYLFTVTTSGTGPPAGTGQQSFTTSAVTISGSTQSVTASFTGLPALLNGGSGGGGGISGLTAGFIPKASTATTIGSNSGCDDGVTTANTITCIETAGINAKAFTASGTTAGFIDFAQGTTSSAVPPCNTANSICEQAPTAVTSYIITKPGAAPTNNFSAKTTTTAGVESYNKMQQMGMVTSDYTNATTTLSNISGLSFGIDASTNYALSCKLIYQGSATTASLVLSSTGPASPTGVTVQNLQDTTAGAGAAVFSQATDGATFGFSVGPTAIVTTATDLFSVLDIGIRNGVNAGTFQLQAKANGAGTVTIKAGSYCVMQ